MFIYVITVSSFCC